MKTNEYEYPVLCGILGVGTYTESECFQAYKDNQVFENYQKLYRPSERLFVTHLSEVFHDELTK